MRIERKLGHAAAYLLGVLAAGRNVAITVARHEQLDGHGDLENGSYAGGDGERVARGIDAFGGDHPGGTAHRIGNYGRRRHVHDDVARQSDCRVAGAGHAVSVGEDDLDGDSDRAGDARIARGVGKLGDDEIGHSRLGGRGARADESERLGQSGGDVGQSESEVGQGILSDLQLLENDIYVFLLYAE